MIPASLCGLPERTTYAKTYQFLKSNLAFYNSVHICDIQKCETRNQEKLETVLASLSNTQFQTFVNILTISQRARHRMYMSICAMVPSELEDMQTIYAPSRRNEPVPSLFAFPLPPIINANDPKPKPEGITQLQPDGRLCLHISFMIEDVDGARDLLVKIAHKMSQSGSDPYSSNILLLQQFASLCQTVSKQLLRRWELKYKWPESWKGIDEVTLDLRRAYAPDGIFLPSEDWLQNLRESRDATPGVFTIWAPTVMTFEEKARDPWNPQYEPFDPDETPSYIN